VQYDLELQLTSQSDDSSLVLICQSHFSKMSIFFQVGNETTQNSTFLDFVPDWEGGNDFTVDLTQIFSHISGSVETFYGYYANDNKPNCDKYMCYYLLWRPLFITEEQYEWFTTNPYGMNARETNQGLHSQTQLVGIGSFGEPGQPQDYLGASYKDWKSDDDDPEPTSPDY